jgi:PleD family two-component response regulator
MPTQPKKVLAVVDDLLFTVKINDAAKRNGLEAVFLKSVEDVVAQAKEKPLMVIVDLNSNSVDTVDLIRTLRASEENRRLNILGFLSHLQGELKQKAQEAGATLVMTRSAFSTNLLQILKRHTGNL